MIFCLGATFTLLSELCQACCTTLSKKQEIVNQHTAQLVKANQKILETISSTLKDKKVDARVKLQITKLLNLTTGGGRWKHHRDGKPRQAGIGERISQQCQLDN